jgi:hypothetical protein
LRYSLVAIDMPPIPKKEFLAMCWSRRWRERQFQDADRKLLRRWSRVKVAVGSVILDREI